MHHRSLIVDSIKNAKRYGWWALHPTKRYKKELEEEIKCRGDGWFFINLAMDWITLVAVLVMTITRAHDLLFVQIILVGIWLYHLYRAWKSTEPLPCM